MGCRACVLHEAVASSTFIRATMSRSQVVATGVCPFVGMISTKCSASEVVTDAVNDARSICMREYATAPEVNIYGDPNFTFAYVPSHLHHMTFELVKNSLRAVNDKFDDSDEEPPPVRLVIAEGEEDITVKVPTCSCSSTNRCLTMMSCSSAHLHGLLPQALTAVTQKGNDSAAWQTWLVQYPLYTAAVCADDNMLPAC